jgi:hypothetical protein
MRTAAGDIRIGKSNSRRPFLSSGQAKAYSAKGDSRCDVKRVDIRRSVAQHVGSHGACGLGG